MSMCFNYSSTVGIASHLLVSSSKEDPFLGSKRNFDDHGGCGTIGQWLPN